jgi:Fimbrial assembly protein (PilN)
MRAINLLPPEAFDAVAARKIRNRIFATGAGYVAILVVLTVLSNGRVRDAEKLVADQRDVNTDLQRTVVNLSDADALVEEYDVGKGLLAQALDRDVSWSSLLVDLSRQIPDRLWLDGFVGTTEDETSVGRITISGVAFDYQDVSAWLRSLDSRRFPGVSGTWVDSIAESTIDEFDVVLFSSTTSLTEDARSDRLTKRTPEVLR